MQLPDLLNIKVEIKIIDALGKIVLIKDVVTNVEDQEEKIDLSGVSSGIYFIQMLYNGDLTTGTILIE